MKRLFSLLLCVILLVTPALAIVDRPANGYVGDYADVLSSELEERIISQNQTLFRSTGAEIVIVSVDFMDGMDAESYAMACFDAWSIGDESRNNGLLLVFAVGENRVWAMRGTGLENALSVSTLNGWLEDYFYDPYDAGDYETATGDFFDAAYTWLDSYYAGTSASSGAAAPGEPDHPGAPVGNVSYLLGRFVSFTIILFVLIVILVLLSRPRYGDSYYYGGYYPRPFFFWRRRRRYGPPAPPRPSGYRPHTGGSHFGGFHSGGVSRGGGAGRRGSSSSSFRSSSHSSFRSSGGGSFRSGGHSRGGGAGRR